MTEEKLDSLLKRMPEIASAVNSFTSEVIQVAAFEALIAAYGIGTRKVSNTDQEASDAAIPSDVQTTPPQDIPATPPEAAAVKQPQVKRGKRAQGSSRDSFKFLRDLDLRPQGKKSFSEFVAEKNPVSNEDRYAVAVYYLQHILEIPEISADHVGTTFRLTDGWREPSEVKAALRVASARKGTIDTSNPTAIRTTPHGRNFVEHDLPGSPKAKK